MRVTLGEVWGCEALAAVTDFALQTGIVRAHVQASPWLLITVSLKDVPEISVAGRVEAIES